MTPAEMVLRVLRVQAQFGTDGFTVYDRIDRWTTEHARCTKHEERVVSGIVVSVCVTRTAVLVHDRMSMGRSRCSQCLEYIVTEEMAEFLANDHHLCRRCS